MGLFALSALSCGGRRFVGIQDFLGKNLGRMLAGAMVATVGAWLANPLHAAETPDIPGVVKGPATGNLGTQAEIKVPAGYVYADAQLTRRILSQSGNIPSGDEVGLVAPSSFDWFVIFEYDDTGHIKDDEKDKLDASKVLESIRSGTAAANETRKERNLPTMTVVGWATQPNYNDKTKNLEWAIIGENDKSKHRSVNMDVRLLGRTGVMSATLVCDNAEFKSLNEPFQKILEGFSYKAGNTYAEYRPGDKLASYGLTALMVGGGAAVAAKAGLFKVLGTLLAKGGKAIIAFVVLIGAGIARLFGKKSDQ